MNTQFTPAPWFVAKGAARKTLPSNRYFYPIVSNLNGDMLTQIEANAYSADHETAKANANLIAAAPGMYEALIELLDFNLADDFPQYGGGLIRSKDLHKAILKAKAALNKANPQK